MVIVPCKKLLDPIRQYMRILGKVTGYRTVKHFIGQDVGISSLYEEKPCGVRTIASFIIDLNSVFLKDLHADDN